MYLKKIKPAEPRNFGTRIPLMQSAFVVKDMLFRMLDSI